ncbi:MAG TPA: ABC transporter permease subunit [Planctomycetaceae bacterium]|nr:ABC transporter permease subunit [Planctomycetaceae bacterium]
MIIAAISSEWFGVIGVLVLVFALNLAFCYATQAGMIARATTKEAVRQPLFPLLIVIGIIVLLVNTFVPMFTLGDDFKMLMDCGLATILICGLLMGVWTSSTSVSAEIEGKTAMTLLSKPINRRQFIVGKYMGILNATMILVISLSILLLLLVAYKVGYDARESSQQPPEMAERLTWVYKTIPGILLSMMEITVLTAVSVAISTRVPMVVNLVTCMTIFVVGHLTAIVVNSSTELNEIVQFMGQVIATVLPQLDNFNITAAIATGTLVPPAYLGLSFLYCLAYSAAGLLLAFILFEDRDLA